MTAVLAGQTASSPAQFWGVFLGTVVTWLFVGLLALIVYLLTRRQVQS